MGRKNNQKWLSNYAANRTSRKGYLQIFLNYIPYVQEDTENIKQITLNYFLIPEMKTIIFEM